MLSTEIYNRQIERGSGCGIEELTDFLLYIFVTGIVQ